MSNRYGKLISGLPTDWPVIPLSRAAERIVSGGTPSRAVPAYWDGQIPWVTPGELTNLDRKYLNETREAISPQGLAASGATLLPRDSLMVTTRATLGSVALAARPTATNQGFKSVVFGQSGEPSFYFHYFRILIPELMRRSSGTTFLEISAEQFGQMAIPVPPIAEQRRIAEILDTADEAIRSSEGLIDKLAQAKQGLLQDLLTRGIHGTGRLRNPKLDADQFKEGPLGLLPGSWRICDIGAACSLVADCPHTTPIFREEGTLVARTTNIKDGRFILEGASYVDEQEYRGRILRAEPQPGDLIFTREAPVGEAFVVPPWMRICLGQRVMLLRPAPKMLDSVYMLSQIYSGHVNARIRVLTAGTTNPHLNVGEVRKFLIPVPPISEQRDIARIVLEYDKRIHQLSCELRKFSLLKQGLMGDLLTGRVRVGVPR